jgi:purine-binding chemotaxis protein CheW
MRSYLNGAEHACCLGGSQSARSAQCLLDQTAAVLRPQDDGFARMGPGMSGEQGAPRRVLVCRAGACLFGFPVESLIEILPPLTVTTLRDAPAYVTGMALVRGRPTPVIDARRVLGLADAAPAQRWVALKVRERCIALAVEEVVGFRAVDRAVLQGMPPLVARVGAGVISQIGELDAELLLVLETGHILESLWSGLRELPPA